ncbi:hypothetical protein ACFLT4_02010 [Chloroflexota bacterium]
MKIKQLMFLILVAFVLPPFLLGCNNKNDERENRVVPKATVPPIDAPAPTSTETATFALG